MQVQLTGRVLLERNGLVINGELSEAEWWELGRQLAGLKQLTEWAVADYLAYGEGRVGERYWQVAEMFSCSPQTVRNMAWVARRIPKDQRRVTLTFTHHRMVAALPEARRNELLLRAERGGWTVAQLYHYVRESVPERVRKELPPADEEPAQFPTWWEAWTERHNLDVRERNRLMGVARAAFAAGRKYERQQMKLLVKLALEKKLNIFEELEKSQHELSEEYRQAGEEAVSRLGL